MTKMDIFMFYGLPAIMMAFAIAGIVLSIYFTRKHMINPVFAVVAIILFIAFSSFVLFSIKGTSDQFAPAKNSTILYEDIRVYVDNDTGETFQIAYNSQDKEYYRYYLDEESVQNMRKYYDGTIKKAENMDIFINENEEYVILDKDFKEVK